MTPIPAFLRPLAAALVALMLVADPLAAQMRVGQGAAGARGPARVGAVTLELAEVPYVRTLPGRAVAYEQAAIRPRVSGMIEEILYTPGTLLAPGAPMFRIEDASYRAALASAEAQLAGAEAAADKARGTVDRYRALLGAAVSSADFDSAVAAAAAADAGLAAARVAVEVARLDLDRTLVKSPIAGIASLPELSVGSLVTANQGGALATVTRIDPIFVDVMESSVGMQRVRDRVEAGSLQQGDQVGLALTLETGATYGRQGTFVGPDAEVSTTTGTIRIRVRFDNPDRIILPGQFLRVEATMGTMPAILVPQRATARSAAGDLTAWVAKEGRARKVVLTETGTHRNAWIVTAGVGPGDLLIVDGLNGLADGAEVQVVPVMIDEQGVVRDLPPEQSPGQAAATPAAPQGGG